MRSNLIEFYREIKKLNWLSESSRGYFVKGKVNIVRKFHVSNLASWFHALLLQKPESLEFEGVIG